jgi:N-acetylmuramidase
MKIRREAHHFRRLTGGRFDKTHPHLSHRYEDRARYPQPADQAGRWDQLMDMIALDANAALQAFSWGAFQVMGFNFAALDQPDAWTLVQWLNGGETNQLEGFFRFSQSKGIMDDWRAKRWLAGAKVYNGEANAAEYAGGLQAEYRRRGGR